MHVKTTFLSSSHAFLLFHDFLLFHALFQKKEGMGKKEAKTRPSRVRRKLHHQFFLFSLSLRFSFFSIFLILKFIASNLKFPLSLSFSLVPDKDHFNTFSLPLNCEFRSNIFCSTKICKVSKSPSCAVSVFAEPPSLSFSSLTLSFSPLQVRYQNSNFSFLLSLSSIIPFFHLCLICNSLRKSTLSVWTENVREKRIVPKELSLFLSLIFHFSCFFINSPLEVFWFRIFCFSQKILFPKCLQLVPKFQSLLLGFKVKSSK